MATIRMWERRYRLFNPLKQGRNIRLYGMEDLKKLLNIAFLTRSGLKISKVAAMDAVAIHAMVLDVGGNEAIPEKVRMEFKLAMYSFDADFFYKTYRDLRKEQDFDWISENCFLPFLQFIGLLWQTNALRPAHEHFMSNLMVQQILLETAKLKSVHKSKCTYVLCLWEQEIHEIGLLYLQYKLKKAAYKVLYLGRSLEVSDILYALKQVESPVLVNHFTITPGADELDAYAASLSELDKEDLKICFVGRIPLSYQEKMANSVQISHSIPDFLKKIES